MLTIHSTTHTRVKSTQSVNYTTVKYTIKNTYIFRKIILFAALQETDINIEVTQLDEKIFVRISRKKLEMVNWRAYRKDSKLLQIYSKLVRSLGKKILMLQNALLRIYFNLHNLSLALGHYRCEMPGTYLAPSQSERASYRQQTKFI